MAEPWPQTIPDPADPSGLASLPMPDEMASADQYVPSREGEGLWTYREEG